MSKHGKIKNGLKRGAINPLSNDSLRDTDSNTISGGMGERKKTSEESRQGFADDELESHSHHSRRARISCNKCNRCKMELSTKARYCRRCYEDRAKWMPLRPTRRKRRYPRVEDTEERTSIQNRGVRSLDRTIGWDHLFNPLVNYQKGPKGEGLFLPGPEFSNLPRFARKRKSSESSISSNEFRKERRREWLKRRAYYFYGGKSSSSADQVQYWSEGPQRCLVCKVHYSDTFVIHGRTAHACVCHRCAYALLERKGKCPQCKCTINGITRKQ